VTGPAGADRGWAEPDRPVPGRIWISRAVHRPA
jgi:hypothetical protein